MRILYVVHDFVPETMAGTEVATYKLARDLQTRYGYEVHIFCRGWDGRCTPYRERHEQLDGLHVRRIDFGNGDHPNHWRRHDAQIERAFQRALDEIKPDLVHIQHLLYLSTDLVALAKARGVPVVVSLHDFWFRCPAGTLLDHNEQICRRDPGVGCLSCVWPERPSRRRALLPWRQLNPLLIEAQRQGWPLPGTAGAILPELASWAEEFRAALLAADVLHSPSAFLKEQLVQFGIPQDRVVVVPNGFQYEPARLRPRQPGARLRLGLIGMHRLKGLHLLIDAFRELSQDAAELHVYGQPADPRYVAEQQRRAAGYNIHFEGAYRQEQVYDIFSRLDALVVPSIWYENCPIVIREAFATGTPVVAADLGGMAEAVRDGVDGLLFTAGDAASLRDRLRWLIEQPAALPAMRAAIVPPPTIEQATDALLALYRRCWQQAAADLVEMR